MPSKPTGRPRGRPKGAKNIPRIEDFVSESLLAPPKVPEVKKGKPRGPWARMTPEERSEYSRRIAANKKGPSGGRRTGVPRNRTVAQHEALLAQEKPIIERIMRKMAQEGQLPDDPRAVEALKETITILRTQDDAKVRLSAARLILDFTKAKPTTKVEHTVKTAEDYLDEMAEDDTEDSQP